MCELMGMECNLPTDITFSFTGFALRGGKTGPHADGWGVALYQGKFASSFLEPRPACESAMANFIRDNPIKTLLAVAHVRKKTRGKASLENTHPFKRVLWGRHWVFAHNGTLPHVKRHKLRVEEPLGETDSEHAFYQLDDRERIRDAFPGGYPRERRRLWKLVAELGGQLGAEGKFNFLLADGRHLYARCGTKLCYIIRKAPFGRATLCDAEMAIDFSAVTSERDRVAVVSTEPAHARRGLAARLAPGSLWVFGRGAAAPRRCPALGRTDRDPVRQRARSKSLVPATTRAA